MPVHGGHLISFLHHGKVSQSGRLAVAESTGQWSFGLVKEARDWAEKLGLPDPTVTALSAECVGEAVRDAARLEMWESVVSSKYVSVQVKAERYVPEYFFNEEMTNHEQLLWFCYRLGILEFRKRYSKKYKTVKCIYGCDEDDTLEHSFECDENPIELEGESAVEMLEYLKKINSERLKKVGIGIYWI